MQFPKVRGGLAKEAAGGRSRPVAGSKYNLREPPEPGRASGMRGQSPGLLPDDHQGSRGPALVSRLGYL